MQPVFPFPHRKDPATEALRTPPHSQEAEQAVLGGLMPVSYTHLDVYKRQPLLKARDERPEREERGHRSDREESFDDIEADDEVA